MILSARRARSLAGSVTAVAVLLFDPASTVSAQSSVHQAFEIDGVYSSRNRIATNQNGAILTVGSSFGVFKAAARSFTPEGVALADAWELNTTPQNSFNLRPDVTALDDSSFLIIWDQNSSVHGQIFATTGLPSGPAFKINDTDQSDNSPRVTTNSKGQAGIVWSFNNFGSRGLKGRLLNQDRSFTGPPFPILGGLQNQTDREAVLREDGSLAICWTAEASDGTSWIEAALYNQDGTQETRHLVDSASTSNDSSVRSPDIGCDLHGNVTITWNKLKDDGVSHVMAQRFDPDLLPLGEPVSIPNAGSRPRFSTSSTDPAGRTVVAWLDEDRNEIHYTKSDPGPLEFGMNVQIAAGDDTLLTLSEIELDHEGRIAIAWGRQGENSWITPQQIPALPLPEANSPFVLWQQAQAPGLDLAPLADADHDGLSSLMEFAFGTPPGIPDRMTSLVEIQVQEGAATLTARLRSEAVERLSLEVSETLKDWQPASKVPGYDVQSRPLEDGFHSFEFSIPQELVQFFRFQATQ